VVWAASGVVSNKTNKSRRGFIRLSARKFTRVISAFEGMENGKWRIEIAKLVISVSDSPNFAALNVPAATKHLGAVCAWRDGSRGTWGEEGNPRKTADF
jgi:hypothetical protein